LNMSRDPVCGMEVDPREAGFQADYRGKAYYFCSEACLKVFVSNPERFLDEKKTGGHMVSGGCCGMGMGFGWLRYFYLAALGLYLLAVLLR